MNAPARRGPRLAICLAARAVQPRRRRVGAGRRSRPRTSVAGVPRRVMEAARMTDGRGHHARRPARRGGLVAGRPGRLHPGRSAERPARDRADRGPHRLHRTRSTWASSATTRSRTSGSGTSGAATSSWGPTTGSCGRIDTFLDARSGYFFEMNPSGLMADSLVGGNGKPAVGRHLERARPPQRNRLDDRDRDPVPDAELQSEQRHLGHQLPAHRPAQERGQHLDRVGPQPGAAAHDQRRPGHRHPRGDPGPRPRHQAVRALRRATLPGRGRRRGTRRRRRRRRLLQPDAEAARRLTVNTDFAQTEVDQRQVNLTRFSLFFPEQRDFFLDGATFFAFASNRSTAIWSSTRSSAGASA